MAGLLPSPCSIYPDFTYWLSAWALEPDSLGANSVLPLNAHGTLHLTLPGLCFLIRKIVVEGLLTVHISEDCRVAGGKPTLRGLNWPGADADGYYQPIRGSGFNLTLQMSHD